MFDFNCRINGKTYYLRILASFVILLIIGLLGDLLPERGGIGTILGPIFILVIIAWALFVISQIRQRANDIGSHPLLITAVAFCTPLFFVLGLTPGQKWANKYGTVPGKKLI